MGEELSTGPAQENGHYGVRSSTLWVEGTPEKSI